MVNSSQVCGNQGIVFELCEIEKCSRLRLSKGQCHVKSFFFFGFFEYDAMRVTSHGYFYADLFQLYEYRQI